MTTPKTYHELQQEILHQEDVLRVAGWKQDGELWYTDDRPNLKMGRLSAYYTQIRTDNHTPPLRIEK